MSQIKKRILLIEPPFFRLFKNTYSLTKFPSSLAYLSGAIKNETSWEVRAYNADFSVNSEVVKISHFSHEGFENYLNNLANLSAPVWEEIKSTISDFKPDVVGITTKTQNFASTKIIARLAKQIDKRITVIVGGPHPSMAGMDVLNCQDIDISVRGEGERTIVELLDAISSGNRAFNKINGVLYREDDNIVETPARKLIQDLDTLSFPHKVSEEALLDYGKYPIEAFQYIFAVRGCPYNCLFCGSRNVWSRKVRFRSPENVIEEIKGLQRKGLSSIHFDDDTFGVKRKYIEALCDGMREHCPGLKWSCEINVKLVDDETVSIMRAAGCDKIEIGVESGNDDILRKIRKNITIDEAFTASEIIKKHGIYLQTYFILGFPQDTEETLNDTIMAMKKIKSDFIACGIFTPYPGTEAFELCKQHGLLDNGYDVSLYNHQNVDACFCLNIPRERFKVLVSRMFKWVDRRNYVNRIRRLLSADSFHKIKNVGIRKSIDKGMGIIFGR